MFWVNILPNRLTQVHVDGGGELSKDAGSGETSLDVEQSGYFVKYAGEKNPNHIFPVGGGGGVSIFWPLPAYQSHTFGIRRSEAGQSAIYNGVDLLNLPANFAGRNLPDVSLNADPYSGYWLLSTVDGGLLDGFGGTSFVAPQLNGISALISQANGCGRLGLWNPMLYRLKQIYGC